MEAKGDNSIKTHKFLRRKKGEDLMTKCHNSNRLRVCALNTWTTSRQRDLACFLLCYDLTGYKKSKKYDFLLQIDMTMIESINPHKFPTSTYQSIHYEYQPLDSPYHADIT